jgi:hypothetical protein
VISRNHCPSPTRVMFNPPSALPALTFEASHAAGSGSVRSVTPQSQWADATRVERACVIELTLLGHICFLVRPYDQPEDGRVAFTLRSYRRCLHAPTS